VLKEAQNALHEREQFMEESETRLFEKVQASRSARSSSTSARRT
jgi:hypothetical protein